MMLFQKVRPLYAGLKRFSQRRAKWVSGKFTQFRHPPENDVQNKAPQLLKAEVVPLTEALETSVLRESELSTVVDQLRLQADALERQTHGMSADINALDHRASTVEISNNTWGARTRELAQQGESLMKRVTAINDIATNLRERNEAQEGQTEKLSGDLEGLNGRVHTLQGEIEQLQNRAEQQAAITREIAAEKEALKEVTRKLDDLTKKLGTRTDQLTSQASNQGQQLALLQTETTSFATRSKRNFWGLGMALAMLLPLGIALYLYTHTAIDKQLRSGIEPVQTQLEQNQQQHAKLKARVGRIMPRINNVFEAVPPGQAQISKEILALEQDAAGLKTEITKLKQSMESLAKVPQEDDTAVDVPKGGVYGEAWLKKQPSDHFTIQLLSATDGNWLRRYLRSHPAPAGTAEYKTSQQGKARYWLVSGSYPNTEAARQALQKLPAPWLKYQPWVRNLRDVQNHIERSQAK